MPLIFNRVHKINMGIHSLVSHFISKVGNSAILPKHGPSLISGLYFDLNGILHTVARESDMSNKQLYYQKVSDKILSIVRQLKPTDTIMLAIDGVAPIGKIEQQRMRRYKGAQERLDSAWDSNAITPGTVFMNDLDDYFRKWLPTVKKQLPKHIIYSSHRVPGEGEHKIMAHLRDYKGDSNKSHVIYGLDSDLIMLSINLPIEYVFLVRERLDKWFDIREFRRYLAGEMRVNEKQASRDFMLISTLIGNDFLPRILSMHELSISMPLLFNYYTSPFVNNELVINWVNVLDFIRRFSEEEPRLLEAVAAEKYDTPFTFMTAPIRDNYYKHVFSPKGASMFSYPPEIVRKMDEFIARVPIEQRISSISKSFLTGMGWTLNYYLKGTAAPRFVFSGKYAPLLVDLAKSTAPSPTDYENDDTPFLFLSPLHVMIAVLPPKSKPLVPSFLQSIYTDPVYMDMFPTHVFVDKQGSNIRDEVMVAKALVPSVAIDRILQAVQSVTIKVKDMKIYTPQTNFELVRHEHEEDMDKTRTEIRGMVETFYAQDRFKPSKDLWKDPSLMIV